jgi:hypothetical protein
VIHRVAIAGLAALAVVGGVALPAVAGTVPATAGPAIASRAAVPAQIFSPPLPSAISCGSARSCLAVGDAFITYIDNTVVTAKPLAWNGRTWKTLSMPVPKGVVAVGLAAASCKSATFCLAVGNTFPSANASTDHTRLYAVTWNGTALRLTVEAPLPSGYNSAAFSAVSCPTARDCVALGYATDAAGKTLDFAETWNGATWAPHAIAMPKGNVLDFDAISCVSATDCVLAGHSSVAGTASALIGTAYAGTWNGKSLTAQKVPVPAKTSTWLTGVSCVSKSRCAASGFGLANAAETAGFGFTGTWNGKTWTTSKAPTPKGESVVELNGVSCATAANCAAVGLAGYASDSAEALSYNGKTWARQAVPSPGKGKLDEFEGVSCPKAGDCVAIGEVGSTDGPASSLAGYWNGKAWKLAAA